MRLISAHTLLSKDRATRRMMVAGLFFTAFLTSCFCQMSAPPNSKVRQLAYEGSSLIAGTPHLTGDPGDIYARPTYQDNVYVVSGPQFKSKHSVDIANLPKWSQDGRELAFLAPCQASFQCVEAANQDGSHRIRITRRPSKISGEWMSAINIAWSPLGDEIAYVEEGLKAWTIISVSRSDGTSRKEIQRLQCLVPDATLDWSPDEKELAFGSCSDMVRDPKSMFLGKPTITIADLSTGNTRVVAEGVDPLWSPDGKVLLFRQGGLKLINPDGTQQRSVLDGELALFGITWLRSGRGFVFGSARETHGVSEIFRVGLDGTGLQKLASGAGRDLSFAFPIVSPDEKHLIVSSDTCSRCSLIRGVVAPPALGMGKQRQDPTPEILLIDLANGREERLASGFHPSVVWNKN